jgi:hypothetical protein
MKLLDPSVQCRGRRGSPWAKVATVKLSPQGTPVISTSLSNDKLQSAKAVAPLLMMVRLAVKPPSQVVPPRANSRAGLPRVKTEVAMLPGRLNDFYGNRLMPAYPQNGMTCTT